MLARHYPVVRRTRSRPAILCALLTLSLRQAALAEPPPAAKPVVELRGSRLTVQFNGTPAAAAFRALDEKGVHVRASDALLKRTITLSFESLDVEDGMRQIVKSMAVPGYAVVYDKEREGRPTFVLFDAGQSLPALPVTAQPPTNPLANAPQLSNTPSSSTGSKSNPWREKEHELRDRQKAELRALREQRKAAERAQRPSFEERRARALANPQPAAPAAQASGAAADDDD